VTITLFCTISDIYSGRKSLILTYAHFYLAPRWGVTQLQFLFDIHGLSYGVVCLILGLVVLVELRLVTDGRTDRQTHGDSIYRASINIASRGKTHGNATYGVMWREGFPSPSWRRICREKLCTSQKISATEEPKTHLESTKTTDNLLESDNE